MSRESMEPKPDLAAAVVDQRDPQKITDLIEQLERDLAATQKNSSRRR